MYTDSYTDRVSAVGHVHAVKFASYSRTFCVRKTQAERELTITPGSDVSKRRENDGGTRNFQSQFHHSLVIVVTFRSTVGRAALKRGKGKTDFVENEKRVQNRRIS